ncbi:MAG: S8 family serine peptidase [Rubrobacteraceae bacterium]
MEFESSSVVSSGPRNSLWRLLTVALTALLLATASIYWAGSARADEDDGDDGDSFVPRQVIVQLMGDARIGAINNKYNTRTLEKFPGSKVYLLEDRENRNLENLTERIQSDRRVRYAEPNYRTESPEGDPRRMARSVSAPEPSTDPAPFSSQYALTGALKLSDAHSKTRGKGTVVAVLDTGMQMGHPELRESITGKRWDFVDGGDPTDRPDGKDNDGDGVKDEMVGHGTHVAGIVKLAAPQAKIMPLRVLDSDGRGNVFVLAEAIRYADRNGADAINLSLGSAGASEFLEDVIEDAADKDDRPAREAVVVAAAGNSNSNEQHYPAAEEDVLAVTSVNGQLAKSDFANYGAWVDIAAPGSEIYSTFPTNQYASWSGTSMSTPFVAGQAALIRSEGQGMGSESVGCLIRDNAQPLGDTRLGKGHADAAASLPSNGATCLVNGEAVEDNEGEEDD